jgi:hypothetical protein
MENYFTQKMASWGLLFLLTLNLAFHLLVITGIIPFEIVWGGRLNNSSDMVKFETVSIVLNAMMLFVVAIHSGFFRVKLRHISVKFALWMMFVLFILNTVGNLFSVNSFEKMVFTPVTFLLAVFCFRLAIGKDN